MTTLNEENIQISFPPDTKARKFDDKKTHGLSHCMKAVDFVVEEADRISFIEFKDPEKPGASKENQMEFKRRFCSGGLNEILKYKFRDTFLYEWASGIAVKPIYFWVLVAIESLSEPELIAQTDDLKRKLPLKGPRSREWTRPIVAGCMIYNIKTWNRNMKRFPVSRIDSG